MLRSRSYVGLLVLGSLFALLRPITPASLAITAWAADDSSAEASRLSNLERLAELHRQGALTDAEFASEKARILSK